jgi:hypothetical protein
MYKHKGIDIYDKPSFADRYTVVIDEDVFGMSENAGSPQGVNMYSGDLKAMDTRRLGRKITWNEVPRRVKEAICQRLLD